VIGAGIGGLAVAFEILERAGRSSMELEVLCLEASDRAGGHLRSTRENGFLYEWAATGFLDNAPASLDLVRRLGLEPELVQARAAAARRYIYARGKLREIPLSPPAFLTSGVLTPPALLRLLCEPLISQRPPTEAEETVFDFASRRIGKQAASILIDALTTGIFAGDVRRLSLEATYPKMRQMEAEHGSLFRAMLAKRKQKKEQADGSGGPAGPGGRLTSFKDGMQALTDALARALGPRLRLNTPVDGVSHLGQRGYRLRLREGAPLEVDAVVLACSAGWTARIVEEMDPALGSIMREIRSAPVTVVHLGYRRDALPTRPDGFGYLIPRGQGLRTLGTLWPSDIFEGRAPSGGQLMSTMVGGAHDPAAGELDDASLVELAKAELETSMGVRPNPYFSRVIRNPGGIPQYEMGHLGRVAAAEKRLRESPGLLIAGNSLHGVSVNLCIENAGKTADRAMEFLTEHAHAAAGKGTR
jgi:oxygen-dependent protoporphyrinogen oxidase